MLRVGLRLWTAECPIHPISIVDKAKQVTLSHQCSVMHPISQVLATSNVSRISIDHKGWKYGSTFPYISRYSSELLEGYFTETMGKDRRIRSAVSE
jgi:hypothetical protein